MWRLWYARYITEETDFPFWGSYLTPPVSSFMLQVMQELPAPCYFGRKKKKRPMCPTWVVGSVEKLGWLCHILTSNTKPSSKHQPHQIVVDPTEQPHELDQFICRESCHRREHQTQGTYWLQGLLQSTTFKIVQCGKSDDYKECWT
jgi:hypothetical protein